MIVIIIIIRGLAATRRLRSARIIPRLAPAALLVEYMYNVCMYMYIYIYISIHLSLCIYIYTHV